MIPWILISIIILLIILLLAVVFVIKGKKSHKTDYFAFFLIGLIWIAYGIFSLIKYNEFNWLFGLGLVFLIIGLINKKKWKPDFRTWGKLNKEERKFMGIIVGIGVLLLVLEIVVLYLIK